MALALLTFQKNGVQGQNQGMGRKLVRVSKQTAHAKPDLKYSLKHFTQTKPANLARIVFNGIQVNSDKMSIFTHLLFMQKT